MVAFRRSPCVVKDMKLIMSSWSSCRYMFGTHLRSEPMSLCESNGIDLDVVSRLTRIERLVGRFIGPPKGIGSLGNNQSKSAWIRRLGVRLVLRWSGCRDSKRERLARLG